MREISQEDFFKFIFRMGVFSAMDMDWLGLRVLNQTVYALLDEMNVVDKFLEFTKKMDRPADRITHAGFC